LVAAVLRAQRHHSGHLVALGLLADAPGRAAPEQDADLVGLVDERVEHERLRGTIGDVG